MVPAWFRLSSWFVCKLALLCVLTAALSGFGGFAQSVLPDLEPRTVGPVTNLAATVEGQPPGSVKLTWTAAENAQVHFVVYLKATDASVGNYGAARMASFGGTEGVIEGLEGGTQYLLIALGMRWNWIQYGTIWGDWSQWVFATPPAGGFSPPPAQSPATEPDIVGRVSNVAVGSAGEPGAARVTWTPAQNAQVHFVVYIRSQDQAMGNYGAAQMQPFVGSEGVIRGLAGGTSYDFIIVGMRWNWVNYGTVWGQWSQWVSTDTGTPILGPILIPADSTDRAALVALYNATGGPNWLDNTNWLSNQPLGEWYGVTTDANGRVTELYLRSNLIGSIPPEVGQLSKLRSLDMSANQLSGPIPATLGDLSDLEALIFVQTGLTGAIPAELGRLSNLRKLSLSSNQLTGEIPPELGGATALTNLGLRGNRLTGQPPSQLGSLVNLEYVGLDSNYFSGPIPNWLRRLTRAEQLFLNSNQFSGTIPQWLGELTNLQWLFLARNQLTGEIPAELGNLPNLENLHIARNQLSGCIPDGLQDIDNNDFQYLGLSFCGMAIAEAPDLVISNLQSEGLRHSAGDTYSVEAGRNFGLFTVVLNQGNGPSEASTLRYFRDQAEIGTEPFGPLLPSHVLDTKIGLTAPTTGGVYRYWSCVDPVTGESDTTNNCSETLEIEVQAGPDLIVLRPTVSNSYPQPGDYITFSATVENQGSGRSTGTYLRIYRSDDLLIQAVDTEVHAVNLSGYDAGQSSPSSARIRVPTDSGTYYYGACVDPVPNESDTNNNCSVEVAVTISGGPDLIVVSPSVSNSNPQPGDYITFSATVENQGSIGSTGTELRVYRSSDRVITTRDTVVDAIRLSGYDAGRSGSESFRIQVPSDARTYYYGACVDPVPNESDTTNNCSTHATVTVSGRPDLVVRSVRVSDEERGPGAEFRLYATVYNQGNGSSGVTTDLTYYRSTDRTIDIRDTRMGDDGVSALDPRGDDDESIRLTAPSAPGIYYYGACVDPVPNESDTNNNCSGYATVTVSGRPDLIVRTPRVDNTRPTTGSTIDLTFQIRNQGDGDSGRIRVTAYRSRDRNIGSNDESIRTLDIGNIEAGTALDWVIFNVRVPTTGGTYYYGACVDAVSNESNTRNNCSTGATITVVVPSDLVVSISVAGNGTEFVGAISSVTATVSNRGQGSAGSSARVRFYRSVNKSFSSNNQIGTRSIAPPSPSRSVSQTFGYTVPNYNDITTVYYTACVDRVDDESNTTNNCSDWISSIVYYPLDVINYSCSLGKNFLGLTNSVKIEGLVQARRDVRSATLRWKAIDSFDRILANRTVQLGSMSRSEFKDFEDSADRWALFDHCKVTVDWVY